MKFHEAKLWTVETLPETSYGGHIVLHQDAWEHVRKINKHESACWVCPECKFVWNRPEMGCPNDGTAMAPSSANILLPPLDLPDVPVVDERGRRLFHDSSSYCTGKDVMTLAGLDRPVKPADITRDLFNLIDACQHCRFWLRGND